MNKLSSLGYISFERNLCGCGGVWVSGAEMQPHNHDYLPVAQDSPTQPSPTLSSEALLHPQCYDDFSPASPSTSLASKTSSTQSAVSQEGGAVLDAAHHGVMVVGTQRPGLLAACARCLTCGSVKSQQHKPRVCQSSVPAKRTQFTAVCFLIYTCWFHSCTRASFGYTFSVWCLLTTNCAFIFVLYIHFYCFCRWCETCVYCIHWYWLVPTNQ